MKFHLKKYSGSEFLRNVFTLVSATGIAQAISLAIYPLLTRLYPPEYHGLFSLFLSIATITGILSTGKYEEAIMIPRSERAARGLTSLSLILSFGFSCLLLVLILVFYNKLPGWLGNEKIKGWLLFIPLSTFMIAVFQTLSFWNNRFRKFKLIAGANLGQSVVNSAVKLSAAKAFESGGGLILGAIVGQFLGAAIYVYKAVNSGIHIFLNFRISELKKLAKEYRYFPRFKMPLKLVNNFSSSLPVFLFSIYFSAQEVGFYSFGFMLLHRPMTLLTNAISKVFSQRIIEKYNKDYLIVNDIRRYVSRMMLLSIIPFIIMAAFGPSIVQWIFGEKWYEAGVFIRIFAPWLYFVFPTGALDFLPDLFDRQKKAMWIENLKFLFRIIALAIGIGADNIYLALYLFSGCSMLFALYTLIWYYKLAIDADRKKKISLQKSEN